MKSNTLLIQISFFIQHQIDCVIHFAALKAVGESCRLPLMYYGNNITGSANLMEVMMEFGVKKIVFSSSATVYGDPEYLPVDEKHPTGKCTNPYGKTKYFMEEIIKDVCAANNVSDYIITNVNGILVVIFDFSSRIGVQCY